MKQGKNKTVAVRRCSIVLLVALITSLWACSPSHILHTQNQVSRDYTYVDFVRNQDPFETAGFVGGEHVSAVKILGFQGDKYLVEFTNIDGRVDYHINGAGTEYKIIDSQSGTILVRDLDAIATIETFAHPSAKYTLKITPVKIREKKKSSFFFWKD